MAPAGAGAFFIDEPVEIEIVHDTVRMRFVGAGRVMETRCSIHSLLVGLERAKRAYAEWERGADFHAEVDIVPMCQLCRHHNLPRED